MRTFQSDTHLKILRTSIGDSRFVSYCRSAGVTLILFLNIFCLHGRNCLRNNPDKYDCTVFQHDTLSKDSLGILVIEGLTENNFHEIIENVEVLATTKDYSTRTFSDSSGLFSIKFPAESANTTETVHLSFLRYDYHPFDTNLVIAKQGFIQKLNIILIPKYKILLKGRIFAGNTLLEDVNVNIRYQNESMQLKTMKCYTDEENYWNCLYLGMFKTEVVTDNPEDSIYLSFSKSGFRSQSYKLRFADYSGDILKFRLKYADTVPDLPNNNLNLKLTYPLGKNSGWFLDLSFYSRLNSPVFDRFRPGMEISLSSHKRSTSLNTLPGVSETKFDTVYTDFFVGPSILFYLTKPYIRRFSTYLGSTFSIALNRGEFVLQPFLGTRYFIDMRKSICMDFRYISYSLNAKKYSFAYNGNATSINEIVNVKRMLINVGVQINF